MNCLECQELLQKRLDGEYIAGLEALERHLNLCVSCGEQHASALDLLEGLKQLPKAKPSANFAPSMVAKVMRDRRHRQEKTRRRVFVTMALAASVLLMLFAAYYWLPRTRTDEPLPKEQIVEKPKKMEPAPRDSVEPKELKKPESRHALTALTERWADTTRDHAKVVMVATNLDAMNKLPAMSELPVDPSVQEVSDGVRSVSRNARKAFDFFARELPMPDVGDQKN